MRDSSEWFPPGGQVISRLGVARRLVRWFASLPLTVVAAHSLLAGLVFRVAEAAVVLSMALWAVQAVALAHPGGLNGDHPYAS